MTNIIIKPGDLEEFYQSKYFNDEILKFPNPDEKYSIYELNYNNNLMGYVRLTADEILHWNNMKGRTTIIYNPKNERILRRCT